MLGVLERWRRGGGLPLLAMVIGAMLLMAGTASAAGTGAVSGTITDAAGAVNGAQIVLLNPSTDDPVPGASTTTGSTGAYTVSGLNAGSYIVEVEPVSSTEPTTYFANTSASGAASPASATPVAVGTTTVANINVTIPAGATITGTVTDPAGAGVGDVVVDIDDASGSRVTQVTTVNSTNATPSSPLGSYAATGLPAGTYYVYFDTTSPATSASGNPEDVAQQWYLSSSSNQGSPAALQQSNAAPLTVAAGSTTPLNQKLAAGAPISGTVTDAATGAPLNGTVTATDTYGNLDGSAGYQDTARTVGTTAVSAGAYTIYGLPAGTYYLQFQNTTFTNPTTGNVQQDASGYYSTGGLVNLAQNASGVTVAAGTNPSVNVAAPQAGQITGTVTANGHAEGGVFVELYDTSGDPVGAGAVTASDGSYALQDVLPGTYKVGFSTNAENLAFQFYSNSATLSGAQTVTVGAGGTTSGINAALSAGGSVSGLVVNAAGAPVTQVQVSLEDANGDVLDGSTTSNNGTYTITGVAPGTYYVEFIPPNGIGATYQVQFLGGKQVLNGSTTISVAAKQNTPNVNAVLEPFSTAGQVQAVPVPTAQTLTTAAPKISGTAKVGDKLTVKTRGWTAGTTFRYQWYAGGKAIRGATASSYTLAGAQYKKAISVAVTGEKSGYTWATVGSARTRAVAAGRLRTVVPKVAGTVKVGRTLSVNTGSWTKGTRFTYQWYANGKAIKKATRKTLKLAGADRGKRVGVKVTGRLSGYGSASRTSQRTKAVAA